MTTRSSSGSLSTATFSSDSQLIPVYSTSGSACTCSQVLVEASFAITLKPNSTELQSVSADVVLADSVSSSTCTYVNVFQKFKVSFLLNSAQVTPRSGNPGYLQGLPLVAGYLASSGTYVKTRKVNYDLNIFAPSLSCSTDSSNTNTDVPLLFNSDSDITCGVSLTLAQLQTACNNQNYLDQFYIFQNFEPSKFYAGIYGDANYAYLADFLTPQAFSSRNKQTLSDKTCFLSHTMVLNIFYGLSGNGYNP